MDIFKGLYGLSILNESAAKPFTYTALKVSDSKMDIGEVTTAVNDLEDAIRKSGNKIYYFGPNQDKNALDTIIEVITNSDISKLVKAPFSISRQIPASQSQIQSFTQKRLTVIGKIIKTISPDLDAAEFSTDKKEVTSILIKTRSGIVSLSNFNKDLDPTSELYQKIDILIKKYNNQINKYTITKEELDDEALKDLAKSAIAFKNKKYKSSADAKKAYEEQLVALANAKATIVGRDEEIKQLNKYVEELSKPILFVTAANENPELKKKLTEIGDGKLKEEEVVKEAEQEEAKVEDKPEEAPALDTTPDATPVSTEQAATGTEVTPGSSYEFSPAVLIPFGKKTTVKLPKKGKKKQVGENQHVLSKLIHAVDNAVGYTPQGGAAAAIGAYDHFRQGLGILVQFGTKVTLGTLLGLAAGTVGIVTGDAKTNWRAGRRTGERFGEYVKNLMQQRSYEINPAVEPLDKWVSTKFDLKTTEPEGSYNTTTTYKGRYPSTNEEMMASAGPTTPASGINTYIATPPGGSDNQTMHPGMPKGTGVGMGDPIAPTPKENGSGDQFTATKLSAGVQTKRKRIKST